MHLAEMTVAGCHIYGAALPAGNHGFQAAVVVRNTSGQADQPTELLHAAPLDPKQLWPTADGALSFAMLVGQAVAVLTRAL